MKNQDIEQENTIQENSSSENKQVDESENKKKWNFKQFIDGNIFLQGSIRKQTKFILFLVFLSIIYIQNKYKNEALLMEIYKTQNEVKELRDKSIIIAADLMSKSRESEVIEMIKQNNINLKELVSPPGRIIIKKKKSDGR